jgi:hypothetical protein
VLHTPMLLYTEFHVAAAVGATAVCVGGDSLNFLASSAVLSDSRKQTHCVVRKLVLPLLVLTVSAAAIENSQC